MACCRRPRSPPSGSQVADGLAAAHSAGVVHRDVKPGNVLIADDGLVKLTDFGVSRAVDEVQLTRTGLIAGTPAFLAPEVARGQDPTAASDVFALGATLYAAVEGQPPFGLDDNAYALLHRVATGAVQPPQRAGRSDAGDHVVARGRTGRPSHRCGGPRGAGEVAAGRTPAVPVGTAMPAAAPAPTPPTAAGGQDTLAADRPRPEPAAAASSRRPAGAG